jgi:hypothetical protein
LLPQPLQQGVALIRVMAVAQKPGEPPPQPHPVGQQALRQQRLEFLNPVINHAGTPTIAGKNGAGKPQGALRVLAKITSEFAVGERPIPIENWSLKIGHWQLKPVARKLNYQ